jgi:acetolactate synthase-1/2/3 large subunit
MDVADAIAAICHAEGVRVIAGVWGQSATRISKSLSELPDAKLFYCRQERVAVDICDGYARVSGKLAALFTDAGPAAANAMGGIVNSWGDSVPVLFFAAHNNRFEVLRRTTKELPLVDLFAPVSKWAVVMNDPTQLHMIMRRAFSMLRGPRPGPVVIGLPDDLASMDVGELSYVPVSRAPASGGRQSDVEEAVRMLAAAHRPYVYVGAGALMSDSTAELVELSELLTLPVATTLNGKSVFPENHPLALGIGGFARASYSTLQAERVADDADLVLTIGCGFKKHAVKQRPGSGAKHIQVDADPEELNKEARADFAILGDAKVVLKQMLAAAKNLLPAQRLKPRTELIEKVQTLREKWWALSKPLLTSTDRPINPFRIIWEFSQLVDPAKTIVLHDAGGTRGTTSQHYVATVPHGFVGFGVQSAMGWSLGAAIGAKAAAPEKLVTAFIGDEAFCETAMDIETAIIGDTPILVILLNNRNDTLSRRGNAKLDVARWKGGRQLSDVARVLGAATERVDDPEQVSAALMRGIRKVEQGETVVIEFEIARVRNSITYLYKEGV